MDVIVDVTMDVTVDVTMDATVELPWPLLSPVNNLFGRRQFCAATRPTARQGVKQHLPDRLN